MTTSHAAAVDAYAGELQLDMVVGSSNVAAVRAAGDNCPANAAELLDRERVSGG